MKRSDGQSATAPPVVWSTDQNRTAERLAAKRTMGGNKTLRADKLRYSESELAEHRRAPIIDWSRPEQSPVIISLLSAMEAKDRHMGQHSVHVAFYAEKLALFMGWQQEDVNLVKTAALLHDVGKIGINDSILCKSGRLTDREQQAIRRHPAMSVDIIRPFADLDPLHPIVMHHHEWYDGSGYPNGLSRQKIPQMARLLHIADSVDAMLFPRCYKKGFDMAHVIQELRNGKGTQFDPHMARQAELWLMAYPQCVIYPESPANSVF